MLQLVRAMSRQSDEIEARVIEVDHHKQLSFESLGVSPEMIQVLKTRGIEAAFPIQSATFTHAFNGEDIIARERTGSGKTIAYALPLIERLRKEHNLGAKSGVAAKVLVLVPTRELCVQVSREIESLQLFPGEVRVLALFGGSDIGQQIYALRRGADVLVATPGRFWDHLERGTVDASGVSKVVLDETDEMLNIGFKEKITDIIQTVKRSCSTGSLQFLLFSATIPQWVKKTAREFMSDDIYFVDMVKDSEHKTAIGVQHLRMLKTDDAQLASNISHLIETYAGEDGRTIVFTNTKAEANKIVLAGKVGTSVAVLHGDIPQDRRQKTFDDFKIGITKCLIATNVAARGLDFPKVDLVIQIGAPMEIEAYIHRSGRTGRAGHSGVCITLYTQRDVPVLKEIERAAKIRFDDVAPITMNQILDSKAEKLRGLVESVKLEAAQSFKSIASEMIEKYGPEEALTRTIALYLEYTQPVVVYSAHRQRPDMTTIKIEASQSVEELLSQEVLALLHDNYMVNSGTCLICNVNNQDLETVTSSLAEIQDLRITFPHPAKGDDSRETSFRRGQGDSDRRPDFNRGDRFDRGTSRNQTSRQPFGGSMDGALGDSRGNLISTIFFIGMPEQSDEDLVIQTFADEGISIRSVKFFKDRETGQFKGNGIITPSSPADLEKILEVGVIRISGRPVKLRRNQPIGRQ